jgi:hypothetical protein
MAGTLFGITFNTVFTKFSVWSKKVFSRYLYFSISVLAQKWTIQYQKQSATVLVESVLK